MTEIFAPRRDGLAGLILGAMLLVGAPIPGARAQQIDQEIGDRIYRIWSGPAAEGAARPSLALDGAWPSQGTPGGPLAIDPVFSSAGSRHYASIDVPAGTALYGTGLVPGPLLRNGRVTTLWNTDAYGWGDGSPSLYESHPWVLGVRPDGTSFGVLADTTERCEIDLSGVSGAGGAEIVFGGDNYDFPVIYVERDSPQEVCGALADLTGHAPMPALWALGFHQCRYQYEPQSELLSVAQQFRSEQIPCDVVWADVGHMDGARVFTFNPSTFPDPAGLNASLAAIGFRSVWSTNPGAPPDPSYFLYNEGIAGNDFVKASNGTTNYIGPMWPGDYLWADFMRGATRQWWADSVASWASTNGIGGVWIDMNEPAVFVDSKTMPEDNVHRADAALGGVGSHARYHNVYGMEMIRATREGLLQARPDERPFILARANYIGGQRYGAVWTGDNTANEYHYRTSITNILNLGLSGQPFCGPDIGGFIGSISGDLYERWIGIGAMFPFARAHTGDAQRKEPWQFGTGVEDTARLALDRRYRLLPHIYTAFWEAHTQGLPVMRPLFFANPADPALRAVDDTFLVGDGLIASIATDASTICDTPGPNFPVPAGATLYRVGFPQTNAPGAPSDLDDPALPDLYLIDGHIVPYGPIVQTTAGYTLDPLTLLVALDENGTATGVLYEDDYDGYDFQSGDYLLTQYSATRTGDTVTVSASVLGGNRARPARTLNIRLLLPDGSEVAASGTEGDPIELTIPAAAVAHAPASRAASDVDGCDIPAAFGYAPLAVQTTPAAWGDNTDEIDALYGAQDADALRVGITGNLDFSATALALFIDSGPGGQPFVDTSTLDPPPSGLQALTGTGFDAGFEPDTLLFMNAYNGTLYVDQVDLAAGEPGVKTYRGSVAVESGQSLLSGGSNPNGMRIALSNANFLGVTALDASDPASADHGFEMSLPWADIGVADPTCGTVRILAMLVAPSGVVSTQVLPPVSVPGADLGIAPGFAFIAGDQFASLALTNAMDMDSDGDVDVFDFGSFALVFGSTGLPPGTKGDANGDGAVNVLDFSEFATRFGCR